MRPPLSSPASDAVADGHRPWQLKTLAAQAFRSPCSKEIEVIPGRLRQHGRRKQARDSTAPM